MDKPSLLVVGDGVEGFELFKNGSTVRIGLSGGKLEVRWEDNNVVVPSAE
jgi:hypothetical protein